MGVLTSQPGKGIWTLCSLALNAARLPLWMIWYLPSSLRQHKDWTYRQAILVQIVKTFLWNASMVEVKTPLSIIPGAEKEKWAVAKVAPSKAYAGPAKLDGTIKPEDCGGTWYPTPNPMGGAYKPELVILHFHGGAYVIGDGRKKDAAFAATTLRNNTDAKFVFCPQYRLSSNPGCRFPAALQDAITSYSYLVNERQIDASKIILSGDSAGANLALALTRYLTEHGKATGLDLPHAILLWSPWVSPLGSLTAESFNKSPNLGTDYVTAAFGAWGARTYQPLPSTGATLDHPYISFLSHAFATKIPIYISTGECEMLFHDDVALYEEMRAVEGNDVHLQVEEHAVHDTILAGPLVGFEKEAVVAAKRAGEWLRTLKPSAQ
ncbi:hypothetical protein CB0940_08038 [Cercospora beticola]|uniref:Alpha/beta hydrolase fold-3 domain-containing protein n=1 Tax=Cercospora beticola TaxID=122368 RepID=A0A2G5HQI4_CERBT|nr:hypothetical protein CB0940_08038 [Cercospora beticola]PIA94788.1 hypothetical protein CB0940_08038 [Cercospora beticola]WPB04594.1 hypothetical protein RHO25_009240 [Cercospora beticola]